MLTEICQYLKNWFNRKPDGTDYPKVTGKITIENGELVTDMLADGQYFRILGSALNDGVHRYGSGGLSDETFEGDVWLMGVPKEVADIADEISAWVEKYGDIDNPAMSPYQSESFDGYSYTKASSGTGSVGMTWQAVFGARLSPWRKI